MMLYLSVVTNIAPGITKSQFKNAAAALSVWYVMVTSESIKTIIYLVLNKCKS